MKLFLICCVLFAALVGNDAADATIMSMIPTACGPKNTCSTSLATAMYTELGCKPSATLNKFCCPQSYDCSNIAKRSTTACQFQGKPYATGVKLTATAPLVLPCRTNIACAKTGSVFGFTSTKTKCPTTKIASTLVPLASATSCCSTGTRSATLAAKEVGCKYNGKTYMPGAQIPSPDICQLCICTSAFDGTLKAPYCTPINCGYELDGQNNYFKGQAPVFSPGQCCPTSWVAPGGLSDYDAANPNATAYATVSKAVCKFGTKSVKFGDGVITAMTAKTCVFCACVVAPNVHCTLLADCLATLTALKG